MRRVMRACIHLVSVLIIGGAVATVWLWRSSDEILASQLKQYLHEVVQGGDIKIAWVGWDLLGRVHLSGVELRLTSSKPPQPFVAIDKVQIQLDRAALIQHQVISIKKVIIYGAHILYDYNHNEKPPWSYLQFSPHRLEGGAKPAIHIYNSAIRVRYIRSEHISPPVVLQLRRLEILPAEVALYSYSGELRSSLLGTIHIQGNHRLSDSRGTCTIHVPSVRCNPSLCRSVMEILGLDYEVLLKKMHILAKSIVGPQGPQGEPRTRNTELFPPGDGAMLDTLIASLVHPLSLGEQNDPINHPSNQVEWGFILNNKLSLYYAWAESTYTWNMNTNISHGMLSSRYNSVTLTDITADINIDHTLIWQIEQLSCRWREASLVGSVSGRHPHQISINLMFNNLLLEHKMPWLHRMLMNSPMIDYSWRGSLDGVLNCDWFYHQPPQIKGQITINQGEVKRANWEVPLRDIQAHVQIDHEIWTWRGQGSLLGVPIIIQGYRQPDDQRLVYYHWDIETAALPAHPALFSLCPRPLADALEKLRYEGRSTLKLNMRSSSGATALSTWWHAHAIIHDAKICPSFFPYALEHIKGHILATPESIQFEDLEGWHERSRITARGTHQLKPQPQLSLALHLEQLELNQSLYMALNEEYKKIWDSLNPHGFLSADAQIAWIPGQLPKIEFPMIHLEKGMLRPQTIPYLWHDLKAHGAYQQGRLTFNDLYARHEDVTLNTKLLIEFDDQKLWKITFNQVLLDDLELNASFRKNLPVALKKTLDTLNPHGKFSLQGELHMLCTQAGQCLELSWDTIWQLANNQLTLGVALHDLHGRVYLQGSMDDRGVELKGQLDLDSVQLLGKHQLNRVIGKISYNNSQLYLGDWEQSDMDVKGMNLAAKVVPIKMDAYGGILHLIGLVDFRQEYPALSLSLNLYGADLERYAKRHGFHHSNIKGVVNAWMTLEGNGFQPEALHGEGQLQISPASLYELPIFLQIFQLPQLQPWNRTAFQYALFSFSIKEGRYDFGLIDLVGQAISLRGRGSIRFDGQANLTFYTRPPRSQSVIPGVRELVGVVGAIGQGWISIRVRGPLHAPVAEVVPLPVVDEALRQFLTTIERTPLNIPRIVP